MLDLQTIPQFTHCLVFALLIAPHDEHRTPVVLVLLLTIRGESLQSASVKTRPCCWKTLE